MIKKSIDMEVEIPLTPNFIRMRGIPASIPIAQFTDDELYLIAQEWTQKLIEDAQRKRGDI